MAQEDENRVARDLDSKKYMTEADRCGREIRLPDPYRGNEDYLDQFKPSDCLDRPGRPVYGYLSKVYAGEHP